MLVAFNCSVRPGPHQKIIGCELCLNRMIYSQHFLLSPILVRLCDDDLLDGG
jgi:hypothetical protein